MLRLPDYIVIDFIEWISKTYRSEKRVFGLLLKDPNVAVSYAEKYLYETYKECEVNDYKQCKLQLQRVIDQVLQSKELDAFLDQHCKYRNCCDGDSDYCTYNCLQKCYREFDSLLRNRFDKVNKSPSNKLKKIDPYVLIDSLYYYIEQNGIMDNPKLANLMMGYSTNELSSIIDFINWLREQNEPFNMYKMPESIFCDVIKKYETSRGLKLRSKTKKEIIKGFSNKSSEQIYKWFNKVLGRNNSRSLSYIFERYYNDKAKYKCILLPLKGESHLDKFVKEYWYDLDSASADSLDIFYSSRELQNTGFLLLEKIKDIRIDVKELPCILIWQHDISAAKVINIKKLKHEDLCELLQHIISFIEKNMDIEEIYIESLKVVTKLRDEGRMVQKIEQNINGINYGVVTGISEDVIENVISLSITNIQQDIKKAKEKIDNIEELSPDMKSFLGELLDEAGISIMNSDNNLKNECLNKFKGFINGVGKVSTNILSVLGSIASIASFFGI